MYRYFIAFEILALRVFNSPIFIIKIENGVAKFITGKVKNSFLKDCEEICARHNIRNAFVYSVKGAYEKPVLKASVSVSKNALQQIRNIWSF